MGPQIKAQVRERATNACEYCQLRQEDSPLAVLHIEHTQGYFQPVKFISRRVVETRSSVAIVRNGKEEPIVLGDEATLSMGIEQAPHTEAPIVFIGYGLTVPEMNY